MTLGCAHQGAASTWTDPGAYVAVSHGHAGGGAEISWTDYPDGNHDNSFVGFGAVGRIYGIATPAFGASVGAEASFYPLGLEAGWSVQAGKALETGPYVAPYLSLGAIFLTAEIVAPISGDSAVVTWLVGFKIPLHLSGPLPDVMDWRMDI